MASMEHQSQWLTGFVAMASVAPLLVLSGCASNTPQTKPFATASVVEFTKRLKSETTPGQVNGLIDAAIGALNFDKVTPRTQLREADHQFVSADGYSAAATYWCPRHPQVKNAEQVSGKYGEFCRQRGGNWVLPYCENRDGDALFLAAVHPRMGLECIPVGVYVVEPKGSSSNPDYQTALRASGYPPRKPSRMTSPAESRVRFIERDDPMHSALDAENTSPNCRPTGKVTTTNADSQNAADVLAKEQVVRRGGNVLQVMSRGKQFTAAQYDKYGTIASDEIRPRGDYEVWGFSFNCR